MHIVSTLLLLPNAAIQSERERGGCLMRESTPHLTAHRLLGGNCQGR